MNLKEKPKIMIVDDSEIVREMMRSVLQDAGYWVMVMDSPLGFSAALTRHKPDLVLMDVTMPALQGDKLVDLVTRHNVPRCPIILHSDRPEKELAHLARSCGAQGYICKSGDTTRLLSEIARLLRT